MIGCASSNSLASSGPTLFWIAQDAETKQQWVAMMDELEPRKISTPAVDAWLQQASRTGSNTLVGWAATSYKGKSYYVIGAESLVSSYAWAFCIDDGTWGRWTQKDSSGNEGSMEIFAASGGRGDVNSATRYGLLQHTSDGQVYYLSNEAFQDAYESGNKTFEVEVQTAELDFDTRQQKFLNRLDVIADIPYDSTPTAITSGNADLSVQWTDDGYGSLSTARTIDMTNTQHFLTRLGSFSRRAFKLSFDENSPFNLKAFEFNIQLGHYGLP